MANEVLKSLETIESLILHGSIAAARERLNALATRKIPREHVLKAATMARIAMLPEISVRLQIG